MVGPLWVGLGHLMSFLKQNPAAPGWRNSQSALTTGGQPISMVSFGEDHTVSVYVSERSDYQTTRSLWGVQTGWGEGQELWKLWMQGLSFLWSDTEWHWDGLPSAHLSPPTSIPQETTELLGIHDTEVVCVDLSPSSGSCWPQM